jgi:hypothetical protein
LNSAGQATVNNVCNFFKPFEQQFPEIYTNYSFDSWLAFLVNSGLAVQDGEFLQITDIGRDFLSYLTERRLFENKPG